MIASVVMLFATDSDRAATVKDFVELNSEITKFIAIGAQLELADVHPKMRCGDLVYNGGFDLDNVLEFITRVAELTDLDAVVENAEDLYIDVKNSRSSLITCGDCGCEDVIVELHDCEIDSE